GSDSGYSSPRRFGVMLGEMQLLLQLGIDRFADQTKTIELFLSLLGSLQLLVGLNRSQQLERTVLLKEMLQSRIIVSPIAEQTFEMVRERVQEFDHRLVVVAVSWSQQETHHDSGQADDGMQLESEILQSLTATDAIVRFPRKV